MGDCWDDRSKWEIYNEKIDEHAHSVQNSKVIRTCLARGKILENVGFFKETRQNLPFIEKHVLMTFEFWTLCACLSIFSLYISHLLLSSQQSPIYIVELFYIQVLTMVIITETLTSTSHHDVFTYLDYIFSCYLHTVGFYPYLLSYIYIYIYIY